MSDTPRNPARVTSYLSALVLFGASVSGIAALGKATGKELPDRYSLFDLVVGGLATHKFARLISKDLVTTPLRMPFTKFEEMGGAGEVNETPRGGHPEHAVGEILSCPFCLAPWIATGYVAGLAISPRVARTWAAVFSVVGASDFLQFGYARIRTE